MTKFIKKVDELQDLAEKRNISVDEAMPSRGSIAEMGKFVINMTLPESEIEARIINEKRSRLEAETGIQEPITVNKVVEFLKNHSIPDVEKFYCEFEISEKITPEEIKELLSLPFEVALTEQNEKIILTTGTAHNVGNAGQYRERRNHSKLSFHTHPLRENVPPINTPSFADIYITEFVDKNTPLIVAGELGMIVYTKPGGSFREARDVILEYCEEKGVDVFNYRPSYRQYDDLSIEERLKLQRQFAEDTGVIIEEATWDDTQGIAKIMEYINLQRFN